MQLQYKFHGYDAAKAVSQLVNPTKRIALFAQTLADTASIDKHQRPTDADPAHWILTGETLWYQRSKPTTALWNIPHQSQIDRR